MTTSTTYGGPERRRAPSPLLVALAVSGVAGIAFVTLCPIGLRPHLAGANVERFAAYAVLGGLIARAAGRRGLLATALVIALAFGLEAAQQLAPGRHAHMADALVKAMGGVAGVAAVQIAFSLTRALARTSTSPA